ncbi:ABC transporter substrate-binding protein [Heyndrickxia oleronia]|uniref:ABC transporter substrate-binding protein n=1 Tax=Heyndrickxia oleronia TaxID=38875 RepID=UPI001B1D89D3|nr:extracellular solute-binding protein [Heyndrickxia oleronia]GIN39877.1 ABC transporter substrate-binding protein [Heyndrickxia oleronia]
MKKYLIISSIILVFILGSLLYTLKPNNHFQSKSNPKDKIVIWAYSPSLVKIAKEFEQKHKDVQIVIKLFNNSEILLQELTVAESAGTPPNIAEISSFYGIYPFIETKSIFPVSSYVNSNLERELVPSITKRFKYKNQMWAVPLGYHIPIIYVNQKVLSQSSNPEALNFDVTTLLGMEDQLKKEKKLLWGIQSDTLYPWYIMTMKKDIKINNSQSSVSFYDEIGEKLKWLPSYTTHLSLTQFANGKGGMLISTSQKLPLIDKLVGSKFEWDVIPFPVNPQNLIPNGNGLIVFNRESINLKIVTKFMEFIVQDSQLLKIAEKETIIPPKEHLIILDKYLQQYRQFPNYQNIVKKSKSAEGNYLNPLDEQSWNNLLQDVDWRITNKGDE